MSPIQIRNQFRVAMLAMTIAFTGMALSTPAAAQSVPGEPCRACTPVKPGPGRPIPDSTPKPKPRPVVCIPFRFPGLRGLLWCPGVGLVRG